MTTSKKATRSIDIADPSPKFHARTVFTMPVSRCGMKLQVMTPVKIGMANGKRNSVLSAARPRNGSCNATAAAVPRSHEPETTRTLTATVMKKERRSSPPIGEPKSNAVR
ncbi:hypothetical protein [Sorangium cellulosum]|uniref:hypothetical protein n=1 Tax=Sorangium cellulosum TaxID=56 RepID=UPI0005D1D684|nr:hypothetical protein [Sorangium cellulosum]